MFGSLLRSYTVYTFLRLLPPNGILSGAKFILRPSLAFSYIGKVTTRYSSIGRKPNLRRCIFTRQGGHPVRHWAVELSSLNVSGFVR